MHRRSLPGMLSLSLALGVAGVGCGSSGSSSSGSGGSGAGSGGVSGGGSGGRTGSGGASQTGSGGTTQTGTGGKGSGGTIGSGGTTQTGTGGKGMTGSGGAGMTGSGGTGTTGTGGATSGSGGSGAGGAGMGGSGTGGGASGGAMGTADESVLERNKNPSRDGAFVQPTLTKAAVAMMTADTAFNSAATFTSTVTNGANVAASPLFLDGPNGTGMFFIPTAGGDVVARKEDGTSAWSTSIGTPATGGIGCPFATTPPLGILSTPVIDAQSKTI